MFTDEQIQKVKKLCQDFKKSYKENNSEISISPYISFDKTHLLIHIYTIKHLDFGSFYDHWTLESPLFYPVFSGNKDKASSTDKKVSTFKESLIDIFKK